MGPNLAEHVPSPHRMLWFTATLAAVFAGSALVCAPVQHEPRKLQLRPGAHRCVERVAPVAVAPTPTRVHVAVVPPRLADGVEPAYAEVISATLARVLEEHTAADARPWVLHDPWDEDRRLAELTLTTSLEELTFRKGSTHCKLGVFLDEVPGTRADTTIGSVAGGAVVRGDDPAACIGQALSGMAGPIAQAYTDAAANRGGR